MTTKIINSNTYKMSPEWEPHDGTLLAWPNNKETWREVMTLVQGDMIKLAALISQFENVYFLAPQETHQLIREKFIKEEGRKEKFILLNIKTNDAWVRDSGPNIIWDKEKKKRVCLDWGFNSWGGKYPPWDLDQALTSAFLDSANLQMNLIKPGIILEGGSIDVNGEGLLLTSESCLLNQNRNSHLNREEIESYLKKYLGVQFIIWLPKGIEGDDTDGHIDDFARFIDPQNIVIAREEDPDSPNYKILEENYRLLKEHPVIQQKGISIHSIPMPKPIYWDDLQVPASYANFYFVNDALILPQFGDPKDATVKSLFEALLPQRKIIPFSSRNFILGQGGIHCLTHEIFAN